MHGAQPETRKAIRQKPDIRAITKLVPPSGNLVQGQSDLPIHPELAAEAARIIAASQNHYGASEGLPELRRAVTEKIKSNNGIEIDADARPLELLITPGGTGALVAIAQTYLKGGSALVFEPYYPYHCRIIEAVGGVTETFALSGEQLLIDKHELRQLCGKLKNRPDFPLKAIIVCSPANPTGKVLNPEELEIIAEVCRDLDLLCIADEVYEHYVIGSQPHVSIAALPEMWERTITVNSFSKSWNISGWRLGYAFGSGKLIAPINDPNSVFYVCPPTPLQRALSSVLTAEPNYYEHLRMRFVEKHRESATKLQAMGFQIYDSGSAFYVWTRVPERFSDAVSFNEMLMKEAGVAGVPGAAFADGDNWDNYMRFCIAREDKMLQGALEKMQNALLGM